MEVTVNFGRTVASFLEMSGARKFYVVGAYVPPSNMPTVHYIEQALVAAPKYVEIILMGNLNVMVWEQRDQCEEEMTMAFANNGLEDMTCHFTPWQQYIGGGGALDVADTFGGSKCDGAQGLRP